MSELQLLAWCVLCGAVIVAGGLGMVAVSVRSLADAVRAKR